jgi:hypothetical protein
MQTRMESVALLAPEDCFVVVASDENCPQGCIVVGTPTKIEADGFAELLRLHALEKHSDCQFRVLSIHEIAGHTLH